MTETFMARLLQSKNPAEGVRSAVKIRPARYRLTHYAQSHALTGAKIRVLSVYIRRIFESSRHVQCPKVAFATGLQWYCMRPCAARSAAIRASSKSSRRKYRKI